MSGLRTSGVWDPWAGVCYPEKVVLAHLAEAKRLGAEVFAGTTVTDVSDEGAKVIVGTGAVEFEADQVVIAAGIWLTKFVPALQLQGRRVPMYWWRPKADSPNSFALDEFPVFIRQLPKASSPGVTESFHRTSGGRRACIVRPARRRGMSVAALAFVRPCTWRRCCAIEFGNLRCFVGSRFTWRMLIGDVECDIPDHKRSDLRIVGRVPIACMVNWFMR
jgi:hypothetical protein